MNFAYEGSNYVTNPTGFGSQPQQLFYAPQNSSQPKVLNVNSTQYSSSSVSPPTPENKENKVNSNSSDKMASKKPLWSPGKPLSPKAQEMIKSGKGRPSDVPPFKWICLSCNRCLRDEWGLEQHIQTVHGARTFACPHTGCSKVFKRKDHLSMHVMTIHEGRKPCKTCKGTVTFKSKEELHQHKLEVHGSSSVQKPTSSKTPSYKCESCDFRTDKKAAMEEHKTTAHVQKPLVPAVPATSNTYSIEQGGWNINSQYYPKHHIDQTHAITTNPTQNGLPPPVIASNAAPTASSYILPGSSQLNYYEAKTNISPHQDIIQEVMGHDMFKGLQDDILNDSLSGGNPSDSSLKALAPVEFQPSRIDGPNVHMNYPDNNMHSNQYDNTSSYSTLTPLNNPDYINYDNLATTSNLDLNLCDMKSVGITY